MSIIFDRLEENLSTGNSLYGSMYTLPGTQFSATVASDKAVTFWLEYGRYTDDPTAFPFSTGIVSVPAGESRGLIVDIAAATQAARLIIDNSSGFTAAVIADFGSK